MRHQWMHAGRLWTNGEPFLAVDAALRDAWQGFSNDQFRQVVELGPQDISVRVGSGHAVVVGADGVVRDDSWMEVFATAGGLVAIVQAAGPDYPDLLARALDYPDADDEDGGRLEVSSDELAVFSAAADGAGAYSMPLLTALPGIVPPVHGPPPSGELDPGLLLPSAHTTYELKVRWYTELDEDGCFARWLLIPVSPTIEQRSEIPAPGPCHESASNSEPSFQVCLYGHEPVEPSRRALDCPNLAEKNIGIVEHGFDQVQLVRSILLGSRLQIVNGWGDRGLRASPSWR